MLTTLGIIFLALICTVVYWMIGVVVRVVDARFRNWMFNHPRWQLNPPMKISPVKVTLMWVLYIPTALVYGIKWLFTTGTGIAHKILSDKLARKGA